MSPSISKLIVPVGTQVVTLIDVAGPSGGPAYARGAVGEIITAPLDGAHSYRVRLPDGFETSLHRSTFAIRRQHQQGLLSENAGSLEDLKEFVIYRCVVGSRAFGLDHDGSDTDRRGIYLPPADMYWSLYGVPQQLENQDRQECYWEIQKFLVLALKANPNVLECLYTPLIEHATPLALELLAMRSCFLSRLVYQTYNGYVMSQFKKLEQDLRGRGAIKWKHAMHLIRLLLEGIAVLRDGFLPLRLDNHRERLLAIRKGESPWDDVNAWRLSLHGEFDAAFASTRLPERPDYETVNAFLIKARRASLDPSPNA
jgi:hypothetical protein